jgi:hypothetical protein
VSLSKRLFASLLAAIGAVALCLAWAPSASAYHIGEDGAVHAYISEQALALYSSAEVSAYFAQIRAGSEHEDEIDVVWDHGGIEDACTTITHFWDADRGLADPVDPDYGVCSGANAYQKALRLWGMALGEYASGDKGTAYHYLGHVAHLLADMSVPAHAHEDMHPFSDRYEDWMRYGNEKLTATEKADLATLGPIQVDLVQDPFYYLFYTTNQVADYFPSDEPEFFGDATDYYGGWMDQIYTQLGMYAITSPRTCDDLVDDWDDGVPFFDPADLAVIRQYSYLYAIRATAALYRLFEETAAKDSVLTVVIERVKERDSHDAFTDPDYFVRVQIGDFWFRNEGLQVVNEVDISPGWAFGWDVGLYGEKDVTIELWDEDEHPAPDEKSDIDRAEGARDLDLHIDMSNGLISRDLTGMCGTLLYSYGQDDKSSEIWFRIIMPNVPPTAYAGPDKTVDEGDLVTREGYFTDPNWEDTHTFLWHMDSSTNGQVIPDMHSEVLEFTPIDNGVYTFTFTVTDNRGASGSDQLVVTVNNVAPEVVIENLTDETGAEIGSDVPFALVGLGVDLAGTFTDVGVIDTHTAQIDWGDGMIQPSSGFDHFVDCTGIGEGFAHSVHPYLAAGTYTIALEVTDNDGGVGTATRDLEVVDAAAAAEEVVESLAAHADNPRVQAAIDMLQGEQEGLGENGALDKLDQGNLNAALEKFKLAILLLVEAEASDSGLDLSFEKTVLVLAAKSVTVVAIAEAEQTAGEPSASIKLLDAKEDVSSGDVLLTGGDHAGAVQSYQQAVREVQGLA